MANKAAKKKEGHGGGTPSKARKVDRGKEMFVVDVDSSDGDTGKESAASATNHLPSTSPAGKKRKAADLVKEEEGGGGGECYSAIRVRRVIKSEADWRTNQDALFLITAASARFLQTLVKDSFAERKKAAGIGYNHVASAVSKTKRYEFISDFVPQKILAKDALMVKAEVDEPE